MSYGDYNQPPVIINDRSSEGLADANIRIGNMKSDIADLEIMLQAMYRVMIEQGVDPKLFEAKIDEIMKERGPVPPVKIQSKTCPKCGKAVKKSANAPLLGKCMYCGTSVPFYPTFLSDKES